MSDLPVDWALADEGGSLFGLGVVLLLLMLLMIYFSIKEHNDHKRDGSEE